MSIELKVPPVGESINEALVGEWLKAEGDFVREGDILVVLETDKVNMDLPAPQDGVLISILKPEGEEAEVGETIGLFQEAEEGTRPKPAPKIEGNAPASPKANLEEDHLVSPAARRLLGEAGLSASEVPGTGRDGRILKEDVQRHLDTTLTATPEPTPPRAPTPPPKAPAPIPQPQDKGGLREEEAVRMTPLRRRVAERLLESQQQAALLTTFNDVDMSEVIRLRQVYRERFQEKHGIKLGFMSFFVKAVIEGLKAIPGVNAEIRGGEVIYRNYFDIGVAVGGGKGLVVPVIRNAERLSFAETEKTMSALAQRARNNKLTLEELQGGTFTISNGGIYGSLLSTPIVNPPQSGILGMHRIEDRPVARNGEVVIRPMMYLALTYDHRLVDGREAVTFLVKVKETIEDPTRILLEI